MERMEEQEKRDLFRAAKDALKNSYAPYSGCHVGAALLAEDGTVYTGVNVENASYGATICAERTACVRAVADGCRSFRAIAVTSDQGEAPMCGICRQFLSEFAPDLLVIGGADEDHMTEQTLGELLPSRFLLKKKGETI
jgi:cytidine deaminase